jgi:hypothetical protein
MKWDTYSSSIPKLIGWAVINFAVSENVNKHKSKGLVPIFSLSVKT